MPTRPNFRTSGLVPLCQPDPVNGRVISCAACCGIYNFYGHDREMVTATLAMQTEVMATWDGSAADIERVVATIDSRRPPVRFDVIFSCHFAGFLDAERQRVGCLLHPLQRGEDLRDYCRHGRETCDEAQCTAYSYLSADEARAVIAACPDWYLYGLCVTDVDLVKGFLNLCARRLGELVDCERVASEPALTEAFAEALALKESWPWARDPGRFGKYTFSGERYDLYRIDYGRLGVKATAHDMVLVALGSVIETAEELTAATAAIDERVDRFVGRYGSAADRDRRHP